MSFEVADFSEIITLEKWASQTLGKDIGKH
jgi:hypothetical protein